VLEAVRRDLVDGEDEIVGPALAQPRRRGVLGYEASHPRERPGPEPKLCEAGRRLGQLGREGLGDRLGAEVVGAQLPVRAVGDERVVAPRLRDHRVG